MIVQVTVPGHGNVPVTMKPYGNGSYHGEVRTHDFNAAVYLNPVRK